MSRIFWWIAFTLAFSAAARAEPEAASGEGRELFIARCSSCHSVDYVEMHARFGTRALWESQVAKMRNAYKAPMSDEDAKAIVNYLERNMAPLDGTLFSVRRRAIRYRKRASHPA